MNPFTDRATIQQLAGEHHALVSYTKGTQP
jgi:hypothetical protein